MTNDPRRGIRWRVAAVVAMAISIVLWRACDTSPEYVLQIEFGIDADRLTNAEVVIDGETAGRLPAGGASTRSIFPVTEGDHVVVLRVPGCDAEPRRFTAGFGGVAVLLVASVIHRLPEDGSGCTLTWER